MIVDVTDLSVADVNLTSTGKARVSCQHLLLSTRCHGNASGWTPLFARSQIISQCYFFARLTKVAQVRVISK